MRLLCFLSYTDCPSKSWPEDKLAVPTGPTLKKTIRKMFHESILYGIILPKMGYPDQDTSSVKPGYIPRLLNYDIALLYGKSYYCNHSLVRCSTFCDPNAQNQHCGILNCNLNYNCFRDCFRL